MKLHVTKIELCFCVWAASKESFSILSLKPFAYRLKLCWALKCLAQLFYRGLTARLQQMNSLSPSMLSAKKLTGKWLNNLTKIFLILVDNCNHVLALHWAHFLILIRILQILYFFVKEQEFKHTIFCNQVTIKLTVCLSLIPIFKVAQFKLKLWIVRVTFKIMMPQLKYGIVLGM